MADQQATYRPSPDYLRQLEERIVEMERDTDRARKKESWTAVANLHRLAQTFQRELDELTALGTSAAIGVDPASQMTDDELLAGIESAVAQLPIAALDLVEQALTARLASRPNLKIVSTP